MRIKSTNFYFSGKTNIFFFLQRLNSKGETYLQGVNTNQVRNLQAIDINK